MNNPIDDQIDELPMHEMTGEEAVKQINPNSLKARLVRRKTRYFMYSMRSAENGKTLPEDIPDDFSEKYETQRGFDGWKNFATTWDVSLHNPEVIMSRMFSEEEEWERVVLAKFPQIQHDGSIKYPDMSVKEKVDKEIEEQTKSE